MTATVGAASTRRRYIPALDGLRGAAIAAVLLFHHGLEGARGGFLGVSLFFTLSGFLITSLILAEHGDDGRIDLRAFWVRRLRRLMPAALLGLVLALGTTVVAVPAAQRAAAVTDIQAALIWLANWRFVLADAPYADVGTLPSPVLHYWSLAIKEQFYLVLPVLAIVCLRRGRRTLTAALVAITLGSLALQVVLPADDRVYYGTDTRAAELALGGLTAVGLVSVAVLTGAIGGRFVPRLLAWRPLRWLSLVSYGLYVIHFPVFLVLTPDRLGLGGVGTLAVRVAVSLLLATASLYLIEQPIRRR